MNLADAVVYDCETFPNAFTLNAQGLFNDFNATWEISHFRDDRRELIQFFNGLAQTQTPMIGFNNINFDYPIIHYFFMNPHATVEQLYDKAMSIINSADRFGHLIWADSRFAPQIDLFKIHHFDNKNKSTGLKALQINMRSPSVVDMPVPIGTMLTEQQVNELLIPYNAHDVEETKQFAHYSMEAINFRVSLIPQFGVDVLNWPDTKIGEKMVISRLGEELCYEIKVNEWGKTKRITRQSPRTRVALSEVIFPYIQFENPEFNRVLLYLKSKVLNDFEIKQFNNEDKQILKTKRVLTDLVAHVGNIDFCFGTGGIHASVKNKNIKSSSLHIIKDIDVSGLYPSIAIVNKMYPEHLGTRFVEVYSQLPQERKQWQKTKGKKCAEANTLKLGANGVYGNSNNPFSVFFDPKYLLKTTINGQLLLCMLSERLLKVPSLQLIQVNTDGITYFIERQFEIFAEKTYKEWEKIVGLSLEAVNYSRMWIRDVNNYVAESEDGSLKLKGAYWSPDPLDYHGSISAAQPPAWHKDLGNVMPVRAAVAAMVHGVDPAQFIRLCDNPYDFMCRAKVKRSDRLLWGGDEIQRNSRYYVSTTGRPLVKHAPPNGTPGAYKRANGVTEAEYQRVMAQTGGAWDGRVCTKNRSRYEARETNLQAGHFVTICNNVDDFDWSTVNYDWYINEARKLII